MTLSLVKATPADIPYLLALREQTMSEHLTRAGLSFNKEKHMQRVLYRFDLAHIIQHNDVTIGALKYDADSRPVSILQLQIAPAFQNKGYGRQLLEQLIAIHTSSGLTLSVLKENPAMALYERLGFQVYDEDDLEFHLALPAANL